MTITLTDLQDELVLSPLRCSDGNGTLSYLFFSEEYVDVQRAKAICAKCSLAKTASLPPLIERSRGVCGVESSSKTDASVRPSDLVDDPSLERLLSPKSKRCRSHSTSDQRRARNTARCSR